ncbi:MAG TPA: exodeoxyribonuclease V subunit gamma [Burkholderiaceae bacterium]|nr:exodeoxyribonuclease V subunit gamma [Burkholderiaceae bacterium]
MLHLLFANRFETLSERLVERLRAAPAGPFAVDHVVVPSAAVQRRLTLDLARAQGICSNVRFAFLARWLWEQIACLVPGVGDESPFDAAVLTWRVVEAFEDGAWWAPQPRLAAYLERADALMRYELAAEVAALFEQYITYRSDWLDAWQRGHTVDLGSDDALLAADQAWQAALWRRLAASGGAQRHPVSAFVHALQADPAAAQALPPAVHVVALPAIAPMHLHLLHALAGHIDVCLYVLNPCQEYWFDVVDRRRLAYLAAHGRADHHEVGHRLLAGWGGQAKAQLALLMDASGDTAVEDACFVAPDGDSLLARLQGSILTLTELAPGTLAALPPERSLEVHVCHSLTRELEVLHDRLLGLFADDATLSPGDVLVVTPDLEAAAPLIDAVFGTAPRERAIAYAITGRPAPAVNAVARALLDLLALATSRCAASEVFALLQQPPVARRFGLGGDDLAQVHAWLLAAGVHWALDGAHRASLGLPGEARHSFADGLDRLLLGHALPDGVGAPFQGRLPAGAAEGSAALALGALAAFVDALGALRRRLATPLPASAWSALLPRVLDDFVAAQGEELLDLREVRGVLDTLDAHWRDSGVALALPVEVVRAALGQALDAPARGGVPTGNVTFASMASLRGLPYRVVCAIGLNDGAFPARAVAAEFDLMAARPRPGDRQRRQDERNVFLDLLLAARERVHLSHVGRSVRDNAPLPPSVLVAELLDVLVPALADDPQDAASRRRARSRLVVEHPLQPFSPEAFDPAGDVRRRSFHAEYAQALRARAAALTACASAVAAPPVAATPPAAPPAERDEEDEHDALDDALSAAPSFCPQPLPPPGPEWHTLQLGQLTSFLRNPSRVLIERRLGLALPREDDELQDDEPLVPGREAARALAERVLPALRAGADAGAVQALARAGTEFPPGAYGRRLLERELAALAGFAARVAAGQRDAVLPPHTVTLERSVDGIAWRLQAAFAELRPSGLLRHRYDALRPSDLIAAWLGHLLLGAAPAPGAACVTTVIGRDGTVRLRPVEAPLPVLDTLLRLVARGLCEPLPFFPRSAWACVDGGDDLAAARRAWTVTDRTPWAEGGDAAVRLAWRGRPDPLSGDAADFRACAHAVLDPLRAHAEGDLP